MSARRDAEGVTSDARPGRAEFEAAGLYDPDSDAAPERLALLEYLADLGATVDDLVTADPNEFPVLASTIAMWGDRELFTIDEVSAATDLERSMIARAWRAAGLPEPDAVSESPGFRRCDVEVLDIVRAGMEFMGEDATIQLLRVVGAAAARVADASVSAFIVNVGPQAVARDPSGLELARVNAESMVLLDGLTRGFDTILRHHMERAFRPLETVEASSGVDLIRRSVGFADLVDSTSWSQQLDLRVLSRALSRFDATTSETVIGRGGRVVKLIGDEVMFVADDAVAAVDVGLGLVAAFASDDELPPVRVGIATGDVLARDGDYSGPIVNLAARVVRVAHPSTLLVDRPTRDALRGAPSFSCGPARSFPLRGFAEPVGLYEVTRVR